jgi:uncharacterized protein (DUF433 family)
MDANELTQPLILANRIAGTRVTVWDIVYYLQTGCFPREIANILDLREDQVQAAIRYIDEHRPEVMEVQRKIEERIARGNSPEVQAKLIASRERFLEKVAEIRRTRQQEVQLAGNPG